MLMNIYPAGHVSLDQIIQTTRRNRTQWAVIEVTNWKRMIPFVFASGTDYRQHIKTVDEVREL